MDTTRIEYFSCLYAKKDRAFLIAKRERLAKDTPEYAAVESLLGDLDRAVEERRHRQIVRVAKVGYWIAGVATAASIASAWYARSQAESAALSAISAKASAASIVSQPALPATPLAVPTSAPAAIGTATPKP